MLGIGEDGHIASLFPGRPFERSGGPPVFAVPDSPKPPSRRITLALSMLATATSGVLVAAGAGKTVAMVEGEVRRLGEFALLQTFAEAVVARRTFYGLT